MSGTTSVYNLPYLEPEDPPDIAGATQDLAEATETAIDAAVGDLPQVQAGQLNVSFTSLDSYTTTITFPTAFPAAPAVMTNIASSAGPVARWCSRAYSISSTGFTLMVFHPAAASQTWSSVPVQWTAVQQ